jgi:hypothetical protein
VQAVFEGFLGLAAKGAETTVGGKWNTFRERRLAVEQMKHGKGRGPRQNEWQGNPMAERSIENWSLRICHWQSHQSGKSLRWRRF